MKNLKEQITYEQVKIGDELPPLTKIPTSVQLFRYSAVTWNTHRIHFDKEYANEEGYPNILVHSHLHGAFLAQLCTDWMGEKGNLVSLEVSVKRFATVGETLTCKGVITDKYEKDNEYFVVVDLIEENSKGEVCAPGKAIIQLPYA